MQETTSSRAHTLTAVLAAGNVLTIEPGIYAEGVGGIRLEDDIAVTDHAPLQLSDVPLALRELSAD